MPLIPRYFDLLVLLIERRDETVSRREIHDAVWKDVVVSDNALNQAIRILRQALGDDPRQPRFVKTLARRGYRFVFEEVVEEPDTGSPAGTDGAREEPLSGEAESSTSVTSAGRAAEPSAKSNGSADPFADALDLLLQEAPASAGRSIAANEPHDDDARREAAEALHALGTSEALRRLEAHRDHPRHDAARAYLRDTRWDVPGAGPVPLLGRPGGVAALRMLVAVRVRRAWRLARSRWMASIAGGALAGLLAGLTGGLALYLAPGATAAPSVLLALPLVGIAIGGLGAFGVGAGLAVAEAAIRSYRRTSLVLLGAAGGGAVGFATHLMGLAVLAGLFGRDLSPLAGGLEGLVLGGAVGLGYALGTPTLEGGMATPRGAQRVRAVLLTGMACALAAGVLGLTGRYLGAMSLDFLAGTFPGSQVGLDPLARLLGEPRPGIVTRTFISAFEGLMFGSGVALGITRRPR